MTLLTTRPLIWTANGVVQRRERRRLVVQARVFEVVLQDGDDFLAVASDPMVSRTIDALAKNAPAALKAINSARAAAGARAWALADSNAPDAATDGARPLIVDLDATLVTSHSDKEL